MQIINWWIKGYSKRFNENMAVAAIPKNGSTSFSNALNSTESFSNTEILSTSKRILFIRHPQERLISCWSFFYMLNDTSQNGSLTDIPLSATHNEDGTPNYEAFIDHVLSVDNAHWHPQILLLEGSFNKVFRFNDIGNIWEYYFKYALPNMNMSRKRLISDYRIDELKIKYADDITLFKSIPKINSPMFSEPPQSTPWF